MKNTKITSMFATVLMVAFFMTSGSMKAQNKSDVSVMKDCVMMKDGKMMQMKAGKLSRMEKTVVMENGTKCKRNGKCIMADGTKVRLQEGNCIDNSGKLDNCAVVAYTCPMHHDVVSGKPGKCPGCGMALVLKK